MNNDSSQLTQPAQHLTNEADFPAVAHRVQIFRAQSLSFGVVESEIATIAEWREPTPLPHAPESVLGVVSVQGRMLTLLDLAQLAGPAGVETVSTGGSYHYILALRGDEQLALAVSELDETIEFSSFDSKDAENDERFVLGVLHRSGQETKILNVRELFPAALQGRERRRRRF